MPHPETFFNRRKTVLYLALSDSTWDCRGEEWFGKCIHCGTRIRISQAGDLLGNTSIEHIVPRSHGGTDDLDNLALACAACNSTKGCLQDIAGPGDPGYEKMIALLRRRKAERAREFSPGDRARLGI